MFVEFLLFFLCVCVDGVSRICRSPICIMAAIRTRTPRRAHVTRAAIKYIFYFLKFFISHADTGISFTPAPTRPPTYLPTYLYRVMQRLFKRRGMCNERPTIYYCY